MRTLGIVLLGIVWNLTEAWGIPSSARLYQTKYGYRPACQACHTEGGGSPINAYGKAFLGAGKDYQAFTKIETQDSDGDGKDNLTEIQGKANPGDKKSLPDKAGEWLAGVDEPVIPLDTLKKILPAIEKYVVMEGRLSDEQVERAKKMGVSLTDDDKVPTFYFPLEEGKRVGVAQIIAVPYQNKNIYLGVAVGRKGTIEKVILLNKKEMPEAENLSVYQQAQGKSLKQQEFLQTSAAPDSLEGRATNAVNRALATFVVALSKN